MINGIEILEKTAITKPVYNYFMYVVYGVLALLIFFFVFGLAFWLIRGFIKDFPRNYLSFIIAFALTLPSFFFVFKAFEPCYKKEVPTGEFEYIVRIADDVSFMEVCDKYNVVAEKDGLYVLRDKEN